MTDQIKNTETTKSQLNWLFITSGIAALITGIFLLLGGINLIIAVLKPGTNNVGQFTIQDNWLVVIFKLLAGFGGIQIDLLHVVNPLDIAILVLVVVTLFSLYAALRGTSKIWSSVALALPSLGIVLFMATGTAGRSAVMLAVMIFSILMLRNGSFNKITALVGIIASVLLLVGDFTTGVAHSDIIAALFGTGYVLLTIWFFLIAGWLFQRRLTAVK